MLYKDKKDVKSDITVSQVDGEIYFLFTANCGKFGTDETIDSFILSYDRLLEILQDREDLTDEEH